MKKTTSTPGKRGFSIISPLKFKRVEPKKTALLKSRQKLSLYIVLSMLLLIVTTVFWALLSAKLQQSNADQLVNTYLYENASTFRNALFPASHTFFIKWPLFWLIHIFGATPLIFQLFT